MNPPNARPVNTVAALHLYLSRKLFISLYFAGIAFRFRYTGIHCHGVFSLMLMRLIRCRISAIAIFDTAASSPINDIIISSFRCKRNLTIYKQTRNGSF